MKQPKTFQKYLASFSFVIIAVFSIVYVAMYVVMVYDTDQYSKNINNYFMYNNLMNEINRASVEFDNYIRNPSDTVMNNYTTNINNAKSIAESLRNSAGNESIYYSIVGIEELIDSYVEKNNEIIEGLDKGSFSDTYEARGDSLIIYNYINIRLSETMGRQTDVSKGIFNNMNTNSSIIAISTLVAFVSVVAFLTIFIIRFSRSISVPMMQLSQYAKEISTGGFDSEDIEPANPLELNELAVSVNKMKAGLGTMFSELDQKARLESELHEREVENLRIISELKNTELKVLQAQINPHFLFNTLNSINRMAFMNNNQDIVNIIEALSEMLRYSLNKITGPITLSDEIENLKRYIYIQKVRFQDKLHIDVTVDSRRLDMKLPCMILQPLVENSIVHGLRPYDYNGDITINIFDADEATIVIVADTGVGIAAEKLKGLKEQPETWTDNESDTQSTSIGLSNVLMRLNNYFGDDDRVKIESVEGEGTAITLFLPAMGQRDHQEEASGNV